MERVSVIEAVTFGFNQLVKKPLFFIGTFLMSILMALVVTIIGLIAAIPFGIVFFQVAARFKDQLFELLKSHFSPPVFLKQFLAGMVKVQASEGAYAAFMAKVEVVKDIIIDFLRGVLKLYWQNPFSTLLLGLLVTVIFLALTSGQQFMYLGWARVSLSVYDKGRSSLSDLFSKVATLLKGILAGFIYLAAIFLPWKISLILFIIWPNLYFLFTLLIISLFLSIYFALKFLFYAFFIVDQDAGVFESLKKSFQLKGAPTKLILLWLLYFAAYLCFGLITGLIFPRVVISILSPIFSFITFVIGVLAIAFVYRRLSVEQ